MGTVGNSLSSSAVPDNVTVTGYVKDDFEAHFDLADIALNPMTKGGGTKIKLIDYFARSLPVVSTPFGARGIEVEADREVVISEIYEFVETIDSLGVDCERTAKIGISARKLASTRYTWESASNTIRSAFVNNFDIG